ncbi:MAG: asparagine synthetase B [Chloroflexi bacterium]|nr:asparagine synthetase B [Chloroflexota bacterium]
MCGVLVVVAKRGSLDAGACRRALSGMTWRGPDLCVSEVFEDRVFIGETILSVTGDLDPADDQQRSRSGRLSIAFNGEIYGHAALAARLLPDRPDLRRPDTVDTRVLLELHEALEPDAVTRELDGMYAYALLDRRSRRLHVARDVQGEKSLYVYEDEDLIVVASEIPAIRTLRPVLAIDAQTLRDYFHTRHLLLGDRAVQRGIRQVHPGSVESLDLDRLTWRRMAALSPSDWIDPGRMEANASRSPDDLADELDAILDRCVVEMLPRGRRYAAVVSGGIDSSLVASYVVRRGDPQLLIAVNHLGKDRLSSELGPFERALGRPIQVLNVDRGTYSGEIVRCQQLCASPLPSHSFVPQALQSAAVRAAGCRVLFGGDGGDEVFGGYDAYLRPPPEPGDTSPSPYTAYAPSQLPFDDDDPSALRSELATAWREALDAYAHVRPFAARVALAMMYCDLVHQLPLVGMRGADLMSMMWSVEVRSVLVRRPVLAFALNLPLAAKADPSAPDPLRRTKTLLKKVFERHYGRDLILEKQGFAGFPNESAAYLGDRTDFLAHDVLGVPSAARSQALGRDVAWKLANVEFFLRNTADAVTPRAVLSDTVR